MAASKSTNRGREITARSFEALLLGYLLTVTFGTMLTFLLPMPKSEAVITMVIAGSLIWTAIAMWVFAVRSTRTMWIGLLGGIALTGAASVFFYLLETGL
ncbi:MAG: DUF3649 domain-containing protein [Pseudomonadota bacterium]